MNRLLLIRIAFICSVFIIEAAGWLLLWWITGLGHWAPAWLRNLEMIGWGCYRAAYYAGWRKVKPPTF